MQIDSVKITLPLRQEFVVSKGRADVKTNYLTILNNRYNGEASGSVHYGPSIEDIERDLQTGIKLLDVEKTITEETLHQIGEFPIHPVAPS